MSVFPFPDISPNEVVWSLVANTGAFVSPLTGATQTNDRGGERWRVRLTFRNLTTADRARLQAFLVSLNGQQHRFTLHDHSYSKRGAIAVSEMLDVAFTAANWQPSSATLGVITDTDSGIRLTILTPGATNIESPSNGDGISAPTAGKSYAATINFGESRASSDGGAGPQMRMAVRDADAGELLHSSEVASTSSRRTATGVTAPSASTVFLRPRMNVDASGQYGSSAEMSDLSFARAFLVDNGFNALLRSEQFDNASWTKQTSTVSANAAAAIEGSTTADELIEDSTAATIHAASQAYTRASAIEYWTGSVFVKANTSQRIRLVVDDGSSNNGGAQFFDASTGQMTSTAATINTGAANAYASIHDYGGGWYRCRVSVRLPATSSARLVIYLCDGASNTFNFNGDGTSGLYLWGAQLQRGGQLGRYTPTTTAAITGTNQTGNRIWLKGLDPDTTGQLLPGDRMEINGQVVMLTSQLDGDESGVGLAEVRPRIWSAPSDEAAVVLLKPSGKFILADPEVSWSNVPGIFSDFSFDCIEDIA